MELTELVSYLDGYLRVAAVPDAPHAVNGLQVANRGTVSRVTGAAGSMIAQAAGAGLDTFVTGEGPHHTFFDAEELKVNVFYAGHYATETVGVKALAEHLHARFHLPWTFLDHPTGL